VTPVLHIGDRCFHGMYEDTVGTIAIFDDTKDTAASATPATTGEVTDVAGAGAAAAAEGGGGGSGQGGGGGGGGRGQVGYVGRSTKRLIFFEMANGGAMAT
jgi:hypothetical protein